MDYPEPLGNLIEVFRRLPGIGPKTARRLAFFVLDLPKEEVEQIARFLIEAKDKMRYCSRCGNIADQDLCHICRDPRRDSTTICVVQEPRDLLVMEKTGEYRGLYHVLHGVLSPIEGVGPDQLRITELMARLEESEVSEVIIATNPNVEGDTTAVYLSRLIKPKGIKVTRIAFGLPVGGDLEYADELTLGRALEGRREI